MTDRKGTNPNPPKGNKPEPPPNPPDRMSDCKYCKTRDKAKGHPHMIDCPGLEIERLKKQKWVCGHIGPGCCDICSDEQDKEIERLTAENERYRIALKEIEGAAGDDWSEQSQHYDWIQDTARFALKP